MAERIDERRRVYRRRSVTKKLTITFAVISAATFKSTVNAFSIFVTPLFVPTKNAAVPAAPFSRSVVPRNSCSVLCMFQDERDSHGKIRIPAKGKASSCLFSPVSLPRTKQSLRMRQMAENLLEKHALDSSTSNFKTLLGRWPSSSASRRRGERTALTTTSTGTLNDKDVDTTTTTNNKISSDGPLFPHNLDRSPPRSKDTVRMTKLESAAQKFAEIYAAASNKAKQKTEKKQVLAVRSFLDSHRDPKIGQEFETTSDIVSKGGFVPKSLSKEDGVNPQDKISQTDIQPTQSEILAVQKLAKLWEDRAQAESILLKVSRNNVKEDEEQIAWAERRNEQYERELVEARAKKIELEEEITWAEETIQEEKSRRVATQAKLKAEEFTRKRAERDAKAAKQLMEMEEEDHQRLKDEFALLKKQAEDFRKALDKASEQAKEVGGTALQEEKALNLHSQLKMVESDVQEATSTHRQAYERPTHTEEYSLHETIQDEFNSLQEKALTFRATLDKASSEDVNNVSPRVVAHKSPHMSWGDTLTTSAPSGPDLVLKDEGWNTTPNKLKAKSDENVPVILATVPDAKMDPPVKLVKWKNSLTQIIDPIAQKPPHVKWSDTLQTTYLPIEKQSVVAEADEAVANVSSFQRNEVDVLTKAIMTKQDEHPNKSQKSREDRIAWARQQPKSTKEEAKLASRYAAMSSLEERAYHILLDLGMIEVACDPDDPDYDK